MGGRARWFEWPCRALEVGPSACGILTTVPVNGHLWSQAEQDQAGRSEGRPRVTCHTHATTYAPAGCPWQENQWKAL